MSAHPKHSLSTREYFGGKPQSETHKLLLDISDAYNAGKAKVESLRRKNGLRNSPEYFSVKHNSKDIFFRSTRIFHDATINNIDTYTGTGFTESGEKFIGRFRTSTIKGQEITIVPMEIESLEKHAIPPEKMLESLKATTRISELSYEPVLTRPNGKEDRLNDGATFYSVNKDKSKTFVATLPDQKSAFHFKEDIHAYEEFGKKVSLIPTDPKHFELIITLTKEMEDKHMSAQTKEKARGSSEEKPKPFFSRTVANQLAQQLRDGTAPMQRDKVQNVPYNPATGRSFHGLNALNLMMQGKRDDRWMTFLDAQNAGYKVKAGEKGTPVQKWGDKLPGEDKRQVQTTFLFNADQLQFIPPMQKKPERPEPYERVSEILKNSGATVVHDQKERAFYNAANDEIHLPKPDSYKNLDHYCQDALNAYFHSTGHPSRMDRETFDSPKKYQQEAEELTCSVATMMMCAEIGIPNDATKNAELATKWADNMEVYPVQFSQGVKAADDAVWRTLRQDQMQNIELNPQNNEVWRPVAEASPAVAVKTFLTQHEVLNLADKEPEKVYAFDHDGVDVFTKPGTGNVISKTELDSQDGQTFAMKVRTEGYDREGNTYEVVMEATVRKNESGLVQPVAPPVAKDINLSTREMALPLEWNGNVNVAPCHQDEKGAINPGKSEDFPELQGAFAECDGKEVLLATFANEKQAAYYSSLVERQLKYQQERPQNQQQQTAQPEKMQEANTDRDTPAQAVQQESQPEQPTPEKEPQPEQQPEPEKEPESEKEQQPEPVQEKQTEAREAEPEPEQQERADESLSPEEREAPEQTEQQEEKPREPAEPEKDKDTAIQEAKEKIAERLTEEKQDADKAANRVKFMITKTFTKPQEPTPYMQTKGVDLIPGTYQNKGSTCIPLYNADGELRSMAYADKDGKKNFAKGTDRAGCAFYDKKAVEKSNVVGFAVGVATAATVSQNVKGVPVVATMDGANLQVVTAAFKEKYPDKQQIIFADRKIPKENDTGKNKIPYNAFMAAKATGAIIVQPRFASDEKDKQFLDFNDLANKSKYGKEAVKEQCESALEKAKEMAAEKAKEQKNEKERSNKELSR